MKQFRRQAGRILWWGRFDPDYSRNRIMRNLLLERGHILDDFMPKSSFLGSFEASLRRFKKPDAVWVPAFRQRDFHSARRFADKHSIPLIFDPLISAWDKAVFERKKYKQSSPKSRRLMHWEQSLFSRSDLVLADTSAHSSFFINTLKAPAANTHVIPVGAEESLFQRQPPREQTGTEEPLEILFYGSFIDLQGPEIIIDAAIQVPQARWTFIGDGPLRPLCEQKSRDTAHIRFEDWLPYENLPRRIGAADVLLGIFGTSPKAGRVIPNKVFQSLACGRPLITRISEAYSPHLGTDMENGITFVPEGNVPALCSAVRHALSTPDLLPQWGERAHLAYRSYFSGSHLRKALDIALSHLGL